MDEISTDLDLTIVIPAYRESSKVAVDVEAASAFLKMYKLSGEIIVVDDGSPDDTSAAARQLQSRFGQLRVLSYSPNRGKGYALRQGMSEARGRHVMFADAGLCVPYDNAMLGLTMLDLNMCDVANGSRRMRGSVRRQQPAYRRLGSKVYSLVVHLFMGVPFYISDTQCGFKIYRRDVANKLYGTAFTDGFMIDVEIIKRALDSGFRILEFPVLWSNDPDTRYDPVKGTMRNLRELIRIRVGLLLKRTSMIGTGEVTRELT